MDVPDDLDYKTEAKHAIGFILEKEDSGYEWSVFSFLTGKEEKIHEEKIRPCPKSFAAKLDSDPDFSQVREVLFLKEHDPTLRSYIPTSPGEIVIYQGSPYVIVTQSGNEWFIKSSDGTTIRCTEQDSAWKNADITAVAERQTSPWRLCARWFFLRGVGLDTGRGLCHGADWR